MKLKSCSAAKKRFRRTGTGKIVCKKASRGHLLMQKSRKQKKLGKNPLVLSRGDAKKIARLLPNS